MVLEQQYRRLGAAHRVVFGVLIILAFICQSFGQPILRNYWDTNLYQPPNMLVTNNGPLNWTFDPAINNPVNINFNQGGLATPLFQIQANTTGDRLRFFNSGNLMMDLAGSVSIPTNTYIQNGFRLDTSTSFQDSEFITEARMDSVIAGLAGQTFYLWTNAHPSIAGTRMAADVTTTDQYLTNVLVNGSNFVANWLTTNFVIGGVIKAGGYHFHIHGFKTQDAPLVSLGWDLIRTNGSGIVTISTGDSTAGAFSTDSAYTLHVHLVSDVSVSTNDVIGARFYVTKTGGGVNWITHVGGTTDSQLETPSLGITANVVSQDGGSATNLTILGFTKITSTTNSSELPPTNQITLGAYNLAGFGIPYWKTDSSNMFFTEPSMFMHNSHWVAAGQAAPTTLNVGNLQAVGNVFASGSLGSLNAELFGYHNGYVTATATSNDTASINPQIICAAGTRKGHGGYILVTRFAVTNGVIEKGGGGIGFFTGVIVGGGSVANTLATTNAAVERMGVQVYGQMGVTNFIWTSRDTAGNESRVDTTISLYPSNTYLFHLYIPPQGRTAGWRLENLNRGEYTNSFETSFVSTNVNLPVIAICNKTNRAHAFIFNYIHATTALGF